MRPQLATLGEGLTPFFIDRGAHPRLPLSPPHDARFAGESPAHYATRMRTMEDTVRELLAAAQATRKAVLDSGRVDTMFKVGDRVLLRTKELLDAADIGKLRPRWDGPFTVTACPSPNAYTLRLPRRMRCSPTVNVDRLKPFFERVDAEPAPGPVADAGQEGEHEVELLLNRRLFRGVTQYLVRWRGHAATEDEWLRVTDLSHCADKVAEYEAAAHRGGRAYRRAGRWTPSQARAPRSRSPGGVGGRRWPRSPRRVGAWRRPRRLLPDGPWWSARYSSIGPTRVGFWAAWFGLAGHPASLMSSGMGRGRPSGLSRWPPYLIPSLTDRGGAGFSSTRLGAARAALSLAARPLWVFGRAGLTS